MGLKHNEKEVKQIQQNGTRVKRIRTNTKNVSTTNPEKCSRNVYNSMENFAPNPKENATIANYKELHTETLKPSKLIKVDDEISLNCEQCGTHFNRQTDLTSHILEEHDSDPFD